MESSHLEPRFYMGLLIVAIALSVFIFLPLLNVFVVAITLTILFSPVYAKLLTWVRGREWLAATLTVILGAIVIFAPLTFFGIRILDQASQLYAQLSGGSNTPFLDLLNAKLEHALPWLNIDFTQYTKEILGSFVANLGVVFSGVAGTLGTFFLGLFAFFYFLKDGEYIKKSIYRMSPLSAERTNEITTRLYAMASSIIGGTFLVAIIEGALVGLGFLIFGLPGAVLWGSVAVFTAFVPIFGIALVVVPGVVTLVITGHSVGAIGFAVWGFLVLELMENFVKPRMIGKKTKVHPLLVVLSILGGVAGFGVTGLLLGPLILSFLLALLEIYPTVVSARRT